MSTCKSIFGVIVAPSSQTILIEKSLASFANEKNDFLLLANVFFVRDFTMQIILFFLAKLIGDNYQIILLLSQTLARFFTLQEPYSQYLVT
jgi:hypothetical protein